MKTENISSCACESRKDTYKACFNAYSPVRCISVSASDILSAIRYLEDTFSPEFLSRCLISIEVEIPF